MHHANATFARRLFCSTATFSRLASVLGRSASVGYPVRDAWLGSSVVRLPVSMPVANGEYPKTPKLKSRARGKICEYAKYLFHEQSSRAVGAAVCQLQAIQGLPQYCSADSSDLVLANSATENDKEIQKTIERRWTARNWAENGFVQRPLRHSSQEGASPRACSRHCSRTARDTAQGRVNYSIRCMHNVLDQPHNLHMLPFPLARNPRLRSLFLWPRTCFPYSNIVRV
jgi:hypothetical protein